MNAPELGALDLNFRTALARMRDAGRIMAVSRNSSLAWCCATWRCPMA